MCCGSNCNKMSVGEIQVGCAATQTPRERRELAQNESRISGTEVIPGNTTCELSPEVDPTTCWCSRRDDDRTVEEVFISANKRLHLSEAFPGVYIKRDADDKLTGRIVDAYEL